MAAVYPGSLPVKEAAGANLSTNPHSQLHDDMYDEIVAIGTELGTDVAGSSTNVKTRLTSMVNPYSGVLTSYTPAISQGGAVAVTVNFARYQRTGRQISGTVKVTVTGSGVAANIIFIGAPVTAATNSLGAGMGYVVDASGGGKMGMSYTYTSTAFSILGDVYKHLGETGSGFPFALAVNDVIYVQFVYEALAD